MLDGGLRNGAPRRLTHNCIMFGEPLDSTKAYFTGKLTVIFTKKVVVKMFPRHSANWTLLGKHRCAYGWGKRQSRETWIRPRTWPWEDRYDLERKRKGALQVRKPCEQKERWRNVGVIFKWIKCVKRKRKLQCYELKLLTAVLICKHWPNEHVHWLPGAAVTSTHSGTWHPCPASLLPQASGGLWQHHSGLHLLFSLKSPSAPLL